jgi:hypothetical protein
VADAVRHAVKIKRDFARHHIMLRAPPYLTCPLQVRRRGRTPYLSSSDV